MSGSLQSSSTVQYLDFKLLTTAIRYSMDLEVVPTIEHQRIRRSTPNYYPKYWSLAQCL